MWYRFSLFLLLFPASGICQKKWDGGTGDQAWASAANWFPDGVPAEGEEIILDNSFVTGSYTIQLPGGTSTVTVSRLLIAPSTGNRIELVLPKVNIASPGLSITGPGDALEIGRGGVFRNASGASSGNSVLIASNWKINDGGRYIHQTPRSNAGLIDQLSALPGTENGVFEFNVPGTAGYTVSLTGNTFGSLEFSASEAGIKSYSGSGSSDLRIRGNLVIGNGATLTSTLTSNIQIGGSLRVDGNMTLNPVTGGTTGRTVLLEGKTGLIQGSGSINLMANFRNIELTVGAAYTLMRNLQLPGSTQQLMIHTDASLLLNQYTITGNGNFIMEAGALLGVGSAAGINRSAAAGNIQTAGRFYEGQATYKYEGNGDQLTGDGIPDDIKTLVIEKQNGKLILEKNIRVTGTLECKNGIIQTEADKLLTYAGTAITSPANQYGQANAGWEESFIDGPFSIEANSSGLYHAPVGRNGTFAPVMLDKQETGAAVYTITYEPSPYPESNLPVQPPLDHVSRQEFWTIHSILNNAADDARISLSWRKNSVVGLNDLERADLRISQITGSGNGIAWEEAGNAPAFSGDQEYGWIAGNKIVSSFSVFTLASVSAFNLLPVQELEFEVVETHEGIILKWRRVHEPAYRSWQAEKSKDGLHFEPICQFSNDGSGNLEFQCVDRNPAPGWNFYRIRMEGVPDGPVFSPVVRIRHDAIPEVQVYPVPARDRLNINFEGPGSRIPFRVVHISGLVVQAGWVDVPGALEIGKLRPGLYLLHIECNGKKLIIPFLKGG